MLSLLISSLIWTFAPAEPDLSHLISGIQSKYSSMSTLSADFVQVYSAPNARTRRENGRVLLRKPGRMRWEYSEPEKKYFVSDGKELFEYIEGERYATKTSAREFDSLQGPFRFLLGKFNLRSDFSRIEFSGEAPVHAGCRVLRLVPKQQSQISEILIEVYIQDLRLSRVSLIKSDRSRTDFIFSGVVENKPLDDAIFRLNLPPGVRVRNGRN